MKIQLKFIVRELFDLWSTWWVNENSMRYLSIHMQYSYKLSTKEKYLWVLRSSIFLRPCIIVTKLMKLQFGRKRVLRFTLEILNGLPFLSYWCTWCRDTSVWTKESAGTLRLICHRRRWIGWYSLYSTSRPRARTTQYMKISISDLRVLMFCHKSFDTGVENKTFSSLQFSK